MTTGPARLAAGASILPLLVAAWALTPTTLPWGVGIQGREVCGAVGMEGPHGRSVPGSPQPHGPQDPRLRRLPTWTYHGAPTQSGFAKALRLRRLPTAPAAARRRRR